MRELQDADLFATTHPRWPHVSPGEWPLTDAQIAEDEQALADMECWYRDEKGGYGDE